jgi:hypothetical protein
VFPECQEADGLLMAMSINGCDKLSILVFSKDNNNGVGEGHDKVRRS